jgi:hypothetical protein
MLSGLGSRTEDTEEMSLDYCGTKSQVCDYGAVELWRLKIQPSCFGVLFVSSN